LKACEEESVAKSIRYLRRGVSGRLKENFEWPGIITDKSVVHVSAGEVKYGATSGSPGPGQNFFYILGDADVWVSNVSPHKNDASGEPGGVSYILHVDWNGPLDIAVTITVEDEPPFQTQGY
jgi:hypothetical protein